MQEFLDYFLSHMPISGQWVTFFLVNLVAYLAARNTVHRRERRVEENAFDYQVQVLEFERNVLVYSNEELQRLNKEYWAMIQKQADQINSLTNQLNSTKTLHLN
ncbi:MAG: hypothetical protein EOO88_31150 [Pedobacter sp.]|nr:MAG: hypothetical protein EOO88_31150 [Pedobacter sp.]